MNTIPAIHPGEILRDQFMKPIDLKPAALARTLRVSRSRVERLLREETPVTTDMALRLARYFQTSPELWMNMQVGFDLKTNKSALDSELAQIAPLPREAA